MTREEKLTAAAFDGPREVAGLTLHPLTLGAAHILEKHKNPAIVGGKFTISAIAEICFVMCHDVETLLGVPEADWEKEVIRFGSKISSEQQGIIEQYCEEQLEKYNDSQTQNKPGGKS